MKNFLLIGGFGSIDLRFLKPINTDSNLLAGLIVMTVFVYHLSLIKINKISNFKI
jgi:hypothetical protein